MNYIIDFIKPLFSEDSLAATIVIVLIILVFWMFKELRSNFLESSKFNQERFEKAICIYSELEFEIFKYSSGKSDIFAVKEKMSKASSFMPYELLNKYIKFKETIDDNLKKELLSKFHKEVVSEIYRLKMKQTDPVTFNSDKDILSTIDSYIKTKIAPFGIPLLHTFLNLIIIIVMLMFIGSILLAPSITQRVVIITTGLDSFFYIMVLYLVLKEGFINKRFKHFFVNWFLFIIFSVGLPLVMFYTEYWYRGIFILVYILFYAFFVGRKGMTDQ